MKIIIASDSYKGCLPANVVCSCIEKGIKRVQPSAEVLKIPMADGGEGTVQSLINCTNGKIITVNVKDPLFRDITALYGILGDSNTAVIEMAAASGLPLLKDNEKNPLIATTFGTGQLIKDALNKGCRKFIIGIGGSATNDGGAGMLMALGCKFLDVNEESIGLGGVNLIKLHSIDISGMDKRLLKSIITVACDVDNPLYGKNGGAYVFAPQKGASSEEVEILDNALINYAKVIERDIKKCVSDIPGAGAAGGMGAAFWAFLNGKLKRGIDIVIEATNLEEKIQGADLIITGEGRIDNQTGFGKAPYGVAIIAKKYNIPVVALCGSASQGTEKLYENYFHSIFSIMEDNITLEESISNCAILLEKSSEKITKLFI